MTREPMITSEESFAFDTEELRWPDVKSSWNAEDLLKQRGMFKFSKIKEKLDLTTADLTKVSRDAQKKGINTYEVYGFGKPKGSQYIVKMSVFREFIREYMRRKNHPTNMDLSKVKKIPKHINDANELIEMPGYYYLRDVCRFSPFKENEEVIKHSVRGHESQVFAKDKNGCWYDETKREFFINMELFVPWFFKSVWVRG